jgi:hexosaminidase
LTEDQGWRIEIKKYPLLTQTGSCRNQTLIGPYGTGQYDGKKYCGYYTQEQIKDIVKYAAARYINIIPEIEIPGHSMAALTSYPFLGCTKGPYKVMETWGVSDDVLCAGNDSSFTFLENVLDEVMQLFPSKLIHIGGDECPKERWRDCALCQKRMKENNLKNEHELQSYFISRIEKYLNSKGRNIIGWDEILEGGLAPNATVMSWRGEEGGIAAAKSKHNAIMTPGTPVYFDHAQSKNEDSLTNGGYNSLKMVYDFELIQNELKNEEAKYILGAQAKMWTEYMNN